MQVLKLLKKYLIDSQTFVSVCGAALAAFFMLEQDNFNSYTLILIFLTFLGGYIYTKFQHAETFRKVLILNILIGVICLLIIYLNPEISFRSWSIILVLGLLYNSKILEKSIRKVPLLKIFYVGLTWALVCSWLILPKFSVPIFLISWLFVTALVLPFDIRDMESDEVITFPKIIGVQNTKYFAYALIFNGLLISNSYLETEFSIAFYITCIFTFALIYFSQNKNRDFYFSFWVEICSAVPLLIILLMRIFGE